jgi:hypothetical protein
MVFSRPTRWLRSPTPQGIPAVAEAEVEGLPELPSPFMDLWMLNEPVLKKHGLIMCVQGKDQTILV